MNKHSNMMSQALADSGLDVVGSAFRDSSFHPAPEAVVFVSVQDEPTLQVRESGHISDEEIEERRASDERAIEAYRLAEANGTLRDRWSLEDFGYVGPHGL